MNYTEARTARDRLSSGCRVGVLVAAFAAAAVCFALVPGDTLVGSLGQAALLAAVSLVAVGLAHPQTLGPLRRGALTGWKRWIGFVLGVGTVAGCLSIDGFPTDDPVMRFACVGALCLLTGVFEEGLFRVLAMDAFTPALGGGRRGLLGAAVASSVLFGVLHVSSGSVVVAVDAVSVAQLVLKPLQAGLFGFFMAALYARASNLWILAAVHGAFNLVYTGPSLLASAGFQQTYATGDPLDLALLVATTLLLVPPALVALASFRSNSSAKSSGV